MNKLCPTCGQPIHNWRLGVRLTPLKADIFDAIRSRGTHTINSLEIASQIGYDRPHVVTQHVGQINDLLEETDWRIEGTRGIHGGYRLVKRCR